jgi:septum site-determining protein MinC
MAQSDYRNDTVREVQTVNAPAAAPPKIESLPEDKPKTFAAIEMDGFIPPSRPLSAPRGSKERSTLTVYRTVRGGQEVYYDGSVIIFGDVNPTARIFAGQDIFVAGVNRGILHAGCQGDKTAMVAAASFVGGQIRIADLSLQASGELISLSTAGVARVHNGKIEIQAIRR